jgi:hypothetical protein
VRSHTEYDSFELALHLELLQARHGGVVVVVYHFQDYC